MNSLDLPKAPGDTRVVVAMSGGVDSSVVAAILKAEGYDVVGITLQLYNAGTNAPKRAGSCCAGQDIHDARRVAEALAIPHYVLDYEEIFRKSVIDPFAESYIAGETPIPCVACNQTVKFRDLLATARDLGAEALATGHYIDSRPGVGSSAHRGLYRPADMARDQSYFLYATTQAQIDFLRFPLGRLTKTETRAIAAHHGLVVADKPDSQDICFVSKGRYADIIERLRPGAGTPGDIVHVDGRTLGRHDGIVNFTIGQRRGIKLSSPEPLYVVALDARTGQVVVGPREALATRRLVLRSVNWLGGDGIDVATAEGTELFVKVRSTRPPAAATVFWEDGETVVELALGEDGVAPGQACVFYSGDGAGARVLGGGIIARTVSPARSMPPSTTTLSDAAE
ncbi:MAG: tRNA 2-thiouridine(34) synthase MnmA [Rhizobiaceae bacterium]|nr:tRNA 2-thiouridine(34) synthase MnmA [Rhizobiaceae bacterium]